VYVSAEEHRQRAIEALGILDTPPDERVDRITRIAQQAFGVPMVSVTLIDRDRQWRKSQIGLGGNEAPREGAFCDVTVRQGDTLIVEDAALDSVFSTNPFVTGDPNLRFYAGHPIQAPSGEHVGTLCILDTTPRHLDDAQVALLRDLAEWVQAEIAQVDQIDQASLVQRALLPAEMPETPGYTLAAATVAAGQIGGDIYDWYRLGDRLRVTLADVMGKGIGPAIIASAVRASLRTAPDRPLAAAVSEVDRLLEDDIGGTGVFVTAFHADVELASGEISFVDAGHSLGFILRADDTWDYLRSTGLPLGMGFDDGRESALAVLHPGDALLCCSDGLLDVLDGDPFEHVRRVLRAEGPQGAVDEAARLARSHRGVDDLTVLVVQRDR
jgi:hypothetical protein